MKQTGTAKQTQTLSPAVQGRTLYEIRVIKQGALFVLHE